MSWEREKEAYGKKITQKAFDLGFIETIVHQHSGMDKGWILKNGEWAPYYLNLRFMGSHPEGPAFLCDVSHYMARMIQEEIGIKDNMKLLGVDMAGIPLTSAICLVAKKEFNMNIPYVYTRPFPSGKLRTIEETREALKKLEGDPIKWGEHNLVEGYINKGDEFIVLDDMVNDMGSKLIARELLYYETKKRGLKKEDITCNKSVVVWDREQREMQKSIDMEVHALVPFASKGIYWLEEKMFPEEFEMMVDYAKNPKNIRII